MQPDDYISQATRILICFPSFKITDWLAFKKHIFRTTTPSQVISTAPNTLTKDGFNWTKNEEGIWDKCTG
jgi:hypothetical protein